MYRKYYLYKGYIELANPSDIIVLSHLRKDIIDEYYNQQLTQVLTEELLSQIYNKNKEYDKIIVEGENKNQCQ